MEVFNNYVPVTLAVTCLSTDTSITITNPSGLSAIGNYRLLIDNEIMLATARSGAVVSVTRGVEGTVAQGHALGATVSPILTAAALNQLRIPPVANIAALTGISGADGQAVFVQTTLSPWTFITDGSALTVDHITVENTSLGGNTRWVRGWVPGTGSLWAAFAFIYIDGVNGNDANQGFYTTAQGSPAAIKTHAEMFRRIGEEWSPMQNTTVNYISYPTDPLHLIVHFENSYSITFNAPPFTQNSTGTFTAVTNRNNATNTPYEVADGSVVTTSDAMRRIRITSGVRAGARAWVAKSTGAGLRRTSEWVTWDQAQIWVTPVVPQIGDAYVVESAAAPLKVSHIVVEHSNGYGANFVGPTLNFNDIDFVPPTTGGTTYFENNGCYLNFIDCLFYDGEWQMRTIARSGDNTSAFTTFANPCFGNVGINNILFSQGGPTENFILAGLGFGQIVAEAAGGISVAFNYLAQANGSFPNPAATHGGQLVIDSMGVMDWHGINGGVTLEDGLLALSTENTNPGQPPSLWGTSSIAGSVGVAINASCTLRYAINALITITGAAGDFTLAGAAQARAWDDTAGAYTANLACTWANLVGGSLKDNAHNLMQNAHAYKNTGGAQP